MASLTGNKHLKLKTAQAFSSSCACWPGITEAGDSITLCICFVFEEKKNIVNTGTRVKSEGQPAFTESGIRWWPFAGTLSARGGFKRCNCLPYYERHNINLLYNFLFSFFFSYLKPKQVILRWLFKKFPLKKVSFMSFIR